MDKPTVKINPSPHEKGSGLTSSISYENESFVEAMRIMFRMAPNERLEQVEFTNDGITVRMKLESETA